MPNGECDRFEADLGALADGELAGEARDALEEHLRACAGCRRELAALRAIGRVLGSFGAPGPPAGFEARMRARIAAERARARRRRIVPLALAAAAAVLGGVAVALLDLGGPAPAPGLPVEAAAATRAAPELEGEVIADLELIENLDLLHDLELLELVDGAAPPADGEEDDRG